MKGTLKTGTVGEESFVVEEAHLTNFSQPGMPEVLSTPHLIWFLEHAALNALLPILGPGESCVGTAVNVQHLAATPPGAKVSCRARVYSVDGNQFSFHLEAFDEHELIAKGTHKRRVIEVSRLAKKVEAKKAGA